MDKASGATSFHSDFYESPVINESSGEVSSNSQHEICTKIKYAQYANDQTFTRKVIPNTVVEIEEKAFYECRKLTSIFLPDKLESIGRDCFSECFSLEMINIPDSVRFIRSDAFSNCKNLRYVKLPKNLKSIPYGMFHNCTKLTSVEIPITVDNIQWGAFYRCESLAAISLPDGIRHIPTNCFYACKSLHNFTFAISEKDPYVTIGARALSNCIKLVKVDLSCSSVYSIGEGCFAFCRSLESVVLSKKQDTLSIMRFITVIHYYTLVMNILHFMNLRVKGCLELM